MIFSRLSMGFAQKSVFHSKITGLCTQGDGKIAPSARHKPYKAHARRSHSACASAAGTSGRSAFLVTTARSLVLRISASNRQPSRFAASKRRYAGDVRRSFGVIPVKAKTMPLFRRAVGYFLVAARSSISSRLCASHAARCKRFESP